MAEEEPKVPVEYQVEPWQAELMRAAGEKPEPWAVGLFDTIFRAFTFAFRIVWDDFFKRIILRVLDLFGQGVVALQEKEDEAWGVFVQFLVENKMLTTTQVDLMVKMKGMPLGINSLVNFMIMATWIKGYMEVLFHAASADMQHKAMAEFRPTLLDVPAAIRNAFLDPAQTTKVKEILTRHGYKDEYIDMLFVSAYQLFDVFTTRDLFLRGELTEDGAKAELNKMGFTDTRAAQIRKLWNVIPPIQDLITMVAKEAFEPDMIQRYGLGSEFPEEQSEWLSKQGLSRFWQEKYWAAHWDYPGPGQVLEMLHRGLLTEEDVAEFYRVVEMPPYWREKLMKISYMPYTRVDTRRMHSMGVLKDEELIQTYMDQGYDLTHAQKMAEFTVRYNSQKYKDLSQAQIIKAYRNSMITREDAQELLGILALDADSIEWLLSSADWEEQLEIQTIYVSAIQKRYLDALLGENETRAALMKLNLPGARIDALIEKWKPDRITERKMPSKTDLDKMYRAKIIDPDTYKSEMYRLGYSWQYTSWYYDLLTKGGK